MSGIELLSPKFRRIRMGLLGIAAAALIPCVIGAFLNPAQFFHAYLIGYIYFLGTTLGAMGLLMLYFLTMGYWGLIMRRILESASRMLPLMALLTIPLLFGLSYLYPWTHEAVVHSDPLLQAKRFYLTIPFFIVRQIIYFAIWMSLIYYLNRWSGLQDKTEDPDLLRKLRFLSGPGLVLYGITVTFAAIDWIMALEPHYYSTTFGFRLLTGQAVNGLAFGTLLALLLSGYDPIAPLITQKRLRDLGNMLLASILLWAYIAFTEYLIIWAGNIPHETSWFRHRFWAGWGRLAWFLLALHFFVPFFLLLQRAVKHRPHVLAGVAAWLLLMRLMEIFWMVEPSEHSNFFVHWMDILIPVGFCGLWLAAFLWQLQRHPLMPAYDPLYLEQPDEQPTAPA